MHRQLSAANLGRDAGLPIAGMAPEASAAAPEVNLWLGVCLGAGCASEKKLRGSETCAFERNGHSVHGFSSGMVEVRRGEVLQYLLLGHEEGSAVRGLWVVDSLEMVVLVSLDEAATVCWWDIEKGRCLAKRKYGTERGDLVSLTFSLERRIVLILLRSAPNVVKVVGVDTYGLVFEIGGDYFTKMKLSRDTGILTCFRGRAQPRFFDLNHLKFVSGKESGIDDTSSEADSPELESKENPSEDEEKENERNDDFSFVQLGSSEIFLAVEECAASETVLKAYRAHQLPTSTEEALSDSGTEETVSIGGNSSSSDERKLHAHRVIVCRALPTEQDTRLTLINENSSEEEVDDLMTSSNPTSSSRISNSRRIFRVLVAAGYEPEVDVFELDSETLDSAFIERFRVNLSYVEVMCISPFRDGKLCAINTTLDEAFVILNDRYQEVFRVHINASAVDLNNVRWISPFIVDFGRQWTFHVLSERLVNRNRLHECRQGFHLTWREHDIVEEPKNVTVDASAKDNPRLRTRNDSAISTETSITLGAALQSPSIVEKLARVGGVAGLSSSVLECGPGIAHWDPGFGLNAWTVNIQDLSEWNPSLRSLLSFFMQWGLNPDLDLKAQQVLRLLPPTHQNYRLLVHAQPRRGMFVLLGDSSRRWTCSENFTALQSLGLIALFIGLVASNQLEEQEQAVMSTLVSHYGIVFPELLVKTADYMYPCLDLLSEYILNGNSNEDIQVAARLLLQVTVERMPSPVRITRESRWAAKLHTSKGKDKRAIVVLGMIGVTHPEDLGPPTAKLVVQGFCEMIPSKRPEDTIIAAELLARGFYVWCPYLDDLSAVVRNLIMKLDLGGISVDPSSSSLPLRRTLHQPGSIGSPSSACQRALIEIGVVKPKEFINIIAKEALRPGMHRYALTALSAFIKRKPMLLLRHLPLAVESVMKTLDPSESEVRKACLKYSTILLHQLVKRFPMVSFHQKSQRFAVGTIEAIILVYDLRTATKWRILEGHAGPISALNFNPDDGEVLVSYSAQESAIRLWRTEAGTSFFGGLLGIHGSCIKSIPLTRLELTGPATAEDIVNNCSLNWTRLIREDGKTRVPLTSKMLT